MPLAVLPRRLPSESASLAGSGQVCCSAEVLDHEGHKAPCQWATSESESRSEVPSRAAESEPESESYF